MSQKSYDDLANDISDNLADNTLRLISPSKVRSLFQDILDSTVIVSGTPTNNQVPAWSVALNRFIFSNSAGGSSGNLTGPVSSTTHALARYSDTTGTLLSNSPVLTDDLGNLTGINSISVANSGLRLNQVGNSHYINIATQSSLGADKTLNININNNRILNINSDITLDQSVATISDVRFNSLNLNDNLLYHANTQVLEIEQQLLILSDGDPIAASLDFDNAGNLSLGGNIFINGKHINADTDGILVVKDSSPSLDSILLNRGLSKLSVFGGGITGLTGNSSLTMSVLEGSNAAIILRGDVTVAAAGNIQLLNDFSIDDNPVAFTTTGATNLTLPTSGTLATLEGLPSVTGVIRGPDVSVAYTVPIFSDTTGHNLQDSAVQILPTGTLLLNTLDALNPSIGFNIGQTSTSKVAFYGATPIVQPSNSIEIITLLTNLGLRATGGNPDINANNAIFNSLTINGSGINFSEYSSTVPYIDASGYLVSSHVTPTELSYVSGILSPIQTQLDNKAGLADSNIFTGQNLFKTIGGTSMSPTFQPVLFDSRFVLDDNAVAFGLLDDTVSSSGGTNPGQPRWYIANGGSMLMDGGITIGGSTPKIGTGSTYRITGAFGSEYGYYAMGTLDIHNDTPTPAVIIRTDFTPYDHPLAIYNANGDLTYLLANNGTLNFCSQPLPVSRTDYATDMHAMMDAALSEGTNLYRASTGMLQTDASGLMIGSGSIGFLVDPNTDIGYLSSAAVLTSDNTNTLAFRGTDSANTQGRNINFKVNNGTRTIDISGNITIAKSFTISGINALTLTTTGATNVIVPTTGTLSTLAGIETFINKTLTSPTFTTPVLGTPSSGSLGSCTSTTQAAANNSNSLATTEYVDRVISDVTIIHSSGTGYTITNSMAATTFSITNPVWTAPATATYKFDCRFRVNDNGAVGDSYILTYKLRKTNGTAADIPNTQDTFENDLPSLVGSAQGDTLLSTPPGIFSLTAGDIVTFFTQIDSAEGTVIERVDIVGQRIS